MTEIALQILGAAAAVLGTAAAVLGWRELFYLRRKARQEVLDRLRTPAANGLNWSEDDRSFKDKVDAIVRSGLDVSELRSRFALPDRLLWKAVQHLYRENKIDVFLWKGKEAAGGHPEVPKGSEIVLPIFVQGLLPPDMRPERSEVETLLSNLR